jgi:hypothetical protein
MISLFEGDGGNYKLKLSKPTEILKLDSFLLLDGSDRVEILESSGVLTIEFFSRQLTEKRLITLTIYAKHLILGVGSLAMPMNTTQHRVIL